jgi:autoinducer 2-degrading protein
MHIVLVSVHVKPEAVEAFKSAIRANAQGSILEPGVVRFDVLQQAEDPTRFTLYEVYRCAEDQLTHRESAHYLRWRDTVTDMMADPRQGIRYVNLLPDDENFASPK